MTSVNIVFRPSCKQGRYPGSLSLRLIHQRNVRSITLVGCRLYPEEWDRQQQQIIYPPGDAQRAAYLESIEQVISHEKALLESYLISLEKQGRYSVDELAALYRLAKDESKLSGYTEHLAFDLKRRGQVRTARAYHTVARGIVAFNAGKDIPLEQINSRLVKDFELHLKEKGRLPNTISYYMRNLRAIYNKAILDKRIRNKGDNPFAGVYTGITKTMKRALSLDELKNIHNLDFSTLLKKEKPGTRQYEHIKNLDTAHRYFNFCFHARGMCFIDLAYLRKDNVKGGFIRYIRKKTGRQIEVHISPEMQGIIDSFAGQTADSPYVFPILKNKVDSKAIRSQYETALRAQNGRLKKIAKLAGVNKPVSTHVARHTWATIGKQQNVPLRVISECLGHTSEKTTLIYLGLLDNSVLDAAGEIVASALTCTQTIVTEIAAMPVFC